MNDDLAAGEPRLREDPGIDTILEAFEAERLPRPKFSPLYLLGLLAVAVMMVLLPLLYLALIGLVGWGMYWHAMNDTWMFTESTSGRVRGSAFVLYLVPLLMGVSLMFFMIKPVIGRRPKRMENLVLKPGEEPKLEAFVARLCAAVGAPMPSQIEIDCDVNAAAALRKGMRSIPTGDLRLIIGLPLAAGMTLPSFGGVLAHEFGHFAQRAGMGLTYIIRRINAWFARVVYERDSWDERLEKAVEEAEDWRWKFIVNMCRGGIWFGRKILWALMQAAHAISCFALRQMEYDADRCEVEFAGSEVFVKTSRRLGELNVGRSRGIQVLKDRWNENRRLARDFPALAVNRTNLLSEDTIQRIAEASLEDKTGMWDTHPADSDRIAAAEKLASKGIFHLEAPASSLFVDFAALSERATRHYYEEEQEIEIEDENLVSNAELCDERDARLRAEEAGERIFHGRLNWIRPMILREADLDGRAEAAPEAKEVLAIATRVEAMSEQLEGTFEAFGNADNTLLQRLKGAEMIAAGYTIQAESFQLSSESGEGIGSEIDAARARLGQLKDELKEFDEMMRDRLIGGLASALASGSVSKDEMTPYFELIEGMIPAFPIVLRLREAYTRQGILFTNFDADDHTEKHVERFAALRKEEEELIAESKPILESIPYPFPDPRSPSSFWDFATAKEKSMEPDEDVRVQSLCDTMLNALFGTLFRAAERLAEFVDAEEERLRKLAKDEG